MPTEDAVGVAKQAAKNLRNVRALVFEVTKADATEVADSKANPWADLITNGKIIPPPFDMFALANMPEMSSALDKCITAMEVNICGFGHQLVPVVDLEESKTGAGGAGVVDADLDAPGQQEPQLGPEALAEVDAEKQEFEQFLQYGSYDEASLMAIRRRQRRDLESTGCSFLELMITSEDKCTGYNHLPAYQMRLGMLDAELTEYNQPRVVGPIDARQIEMMPRKRRFRRFVQVSRRGINTQETWFKEFGDPRAISVKDGSVLTGESAKDPKQRANAVLYRRIYNPRTPYGVPRYIGALLAILGGRAAEEINFTTFKNNNVPSMMMMVSNGQLTTGSISRIKDFTESVIQGSDNYSKFLIVEAEADVNDVGTAASNVHIDVKPLTAVQHDDAMFQKYEAKNEEKIRSAYRLPPIIVGMAADHSRNTADASRKLADEQVFAPERLEEDHDWNRLLRRMGMHWHGFRSNGPNVTDDQDIIMIMAAAERSGAMTPRVAHAMVEDVMGREMPMPKGIDLDKPFSATMAEAVQNKAKPNEVGQQVTALKRDTALGILVRIEKAMADGAVPAIKLDNAIVDYVVSGLVHVVKVDEPMTVDGRVFALLNSTHAVGFVRLSKAKEGDNIYNVLEVDAIEPSVYAIIVGGAQVMDAVKLA